MAVATFDTAKSVDALEAVEISREQARAIVELVRSSHEATDVATKGDLVNLEQRMETRFVEVKGELTLLKWMLTVLITGVAGLLVRAFFMP